MTENDARFYDAFKDNMGQYPLTLLQFVRYLNGVPDAIPSETYTGLADAYNMWYDAITGEAK